MLRGDVDCFYHALQRDHPIPPSGHITKLDHVRAIAEYYAGLPQSERLLLLAWAKKEESGIGMIPLALSAIPFLGLLLGTRVQEPFAKTSVWVVFSLWGVASLVLLLGFYVHQRQKAFSMLHIVLLEQAIKQGEMETTQQQAADREYPRPNVSNYRHSHGLALSGPTHSVGTPEDEQSHLKQQG